MATKEEAVSRAELVQRLHAIAQRAAEAEGASLHDIAGELEKLAMQMREAPAASEAPSVSARTAAVGDGGEGDAAMDGEAEAGADGTDGAGQRPTKKQRKAPREFDFSRFRTRHVALELLYVGWSFQGFARQDSTENTIEGVFFTALRKVRLIPEADPVSSLGYSRCGRTDRGVSALGQVVALRLRSAARVDQPEAPLESELDYPRIINKALPPEVRVLGWTPAPEGFNARFSAQWRQYKYFIIQHHVPAAGANGQPPSGGDQSEAAASAPSPAAASAPASAPPACSLDIGAMREAAAAFVGEHDFRNFCKPDVAAVRSFRRRILSFTVDPVTTASGGGAGGGGRHEVYALTVRGTAFLWHQVRCMAAILLMVGRGQEAPTIVARLLDLGATPCKPQYSMAAEEPLLLHACGFEGLSFRRSGPAVQGALGEVGSILHRHLIGAALTEACYARMASDERLPEPAAASAGGGEGRGKGGGGGGGAREGHIPLLRRQTEPSIEERMARRGIAWPSDSCGGGGGGGPGAGAGGGGGGDEEGDDAMCE
ncbi:hypothetical protein HYH03_012022 [Edaphochlamys debaryana]|uniref:Pseudouridine synthase I TruA alpha/beta domain-containing protein n=1 Tax=Edaphochlamys debaryana TaxID=47281 RepID=A0A835Y1V5_9CHLO|nr:hypothetical protein HYH03_012022 [Edaphochlamys debaryana]|eukprot:KAG2489574.1 hypothetical protein HYH03_012022 [Edaphochlamys debaryana]